VANLLPAEYVQSQGDVNWWVPSGQVFYSPGSSDPPSKESDHAKEHFFLPFRYRDPFHTSALSTEVVVTYDAYDLLVSNTRDATGNTVTAQHDYRVL